MTTIPDFAEEGYFTIPDCREESYGDLVGNAWQ